MRAKQLSLRIGPFAVRISTDVPDVIEGIHLLYPRSVLIEDDRFLDFQVGVRHERGLRRWIRRQAIFDFEGHEPFKPLPIDQALAMFEWGLNYVIGSNAHQYLIIHAAAIEKNGAVAILPGTPGSGKSTLTAALVHRGWRLLSDELALIRRKDGLVVPLARPINLKNASIAVMRQFVPDGVFSREVHDTIKGTVALLRAPTESIERMDEGAPPRWIIFPLWRPEGPAELEPISKADAFMTTCRNSVNYTVLGAAGFQSLADAFEKCDCYHFGYHSLEDAVATFNALAASI